MGQDPIGPKWDRTWSIFILHLKQEGLSSEYLFKLNSAMLVAARGWTYCIPIPNLSTAQTMWNSLANENQK